MEALNKWALGIATALLLALTTALGGVYVSKASDIQQSDKDQNKRLSDLEKEGARREERDKRIDEALQNLNKQQGQILERLPRGESNGR